MKALILTKFEYLDWTSSVAHGYGVHYITDLNYEIPQDYDVGISFMWTKKIPVEHVNSRPWFNFHPAPLPEYKGRNLCYHAIMNGETEFGATLHYMDENFDTGDIIDVQKFVILPHYTAEDVSKIAIEMSKVQFSLFFPEIISGKQFERLPNVDGTYYTKGGIVDETTLDHDVALSRWIRAVTYREFYPKVDIGGVTYKIVRDE